MNINVMNPFEPHIPSVFVIASPFQALCAVSAIRQLQIDDYKVVAFLPTDDPRSEQLDKYLRSEAIQYTPIRRFNRLIWLYYKLDANRRRHNEYKRLFLGDFRGIILHFIGYRYVSDNSKVIYLDDGNITISILNDIISEPMNDNNRARLERVSKRRGFVYQKNLLTIYGNLENPKYLIKTLDLSYAVSQENSMYKKSGVFIVGTNIERFCTPLDISKEAFIGSLKKLISNIKNEYPNERIVYIPHGRDTSEYALNLCKEYDCEFHKSEIMIELELLDLKINPLAIFGFTSSALYNIKKIYPETRVVNVLYERDDSNIAYQEYKMLSNFYLNNGIELVTERFNVSQK